jgi:N-acetylglucosaminyl-diphospho-decaprenol L-rhamnosyltransferase
MTARLPIDVVTVTWNSRDIVLRCLDRLNRSLVETIVVVDNGSSDGTAEAVRNRRRGAEVVRLDQGRSLAAAYNRGAERGSAELVLFLNDDVLATDASIATLAETLHTRPGAVAAAGRLVDPETGKTQSEYLPQPFPTPATFIAGFLGRGARHSALDDATTVVVDQPPGACLLVRREAFKAAGEWDEDFEFWYEDVDLAQRLRDHGEVLYVPSAPFEHVGGWSAQRLTRADRVGRHYRGALLYASKHFGPAQRVSTGLLYGLIAAVRIAVAPGDRAARSAYSGVLRDGLRLASGRNVVRS